MNLLRSSFCATIVAFALATSCHAGIFVNGNFDADPFDDGWSVSENVLPHAGLVSGSAQSAFIRPEGSIGGLPVNLVQNLPNTLTYITPPRFNTETGEPTRSEFTATPAKWEIGFFMAVADPNGATRRSLNVLIGHDTPDPEGTNDALSPQINLRVTGDGAVSAFNTGSGWHTIFPAGTVSFSQTDGDAFVSPHVYHLSIKGDYSTETPYYIAELEDTTSGEVLASSPAHAWQYAPPKAGDGIIRIRFHGVVNSPYAVDYVSPLLGRGTTITLN